MFDFLECEKKKMDSCKKEKKKPPPGRWQVGLHTRGQKRGSFGLLAISFHFFDRSSIRIVASRSKTISAGGVWCGGGQPTVHIQAWIIQATAFVTLTGLYGHWGGSPVCPSIWTHTTQAGTLTEGTLHRFNIFFTWWWHRWIRTRTCTVRLR